MYFKGENIHIHVYVHVLKGELYIKHAYVELAISGDANGTWRSSRSFSQASAMEMNRRPPVITDVA